MPSRLICLLVTMAMALSLVMTGCGKASEKVAEKASEKAIEDATGGKAKVDLNKDKIEVKTDEGTYKAGSTYEWPSQIPADVPKFSYGKIITVTESSTVQGNSVFVGINEVKDDAYDKYKSALESAGWKINLTNRSNDGFLITATKDKQNVIASFSNKSEKGVSGGVTYSQTN